FGSDDLKGNVWVANFMFTHCTATCPRQTERLAELQRHARRWPDKDRVKFISFTVDPDHDNVERLGEYAELHQAEHVSWRFLTGSRDDLYRISKEGFKLSVSAAAADGSAPLTHSSQFALVDGNHRLRGFYDSLDDADFQR